MQSVLDFIKSYFGALKSLIIKITCSRKALFHITTKVMAGYLIFNLDESLFRVAVFMISGIFDLAYAGIITFESVKTNVNVGVSK
ncbi:hypothetical protein NO1_1206 [Candidatus Termititenax aidoneus]|uniref:Uncharacterized protein n=1 Tax=Termititenax aidoneus TaxID=2218524 RepID=A0A388TBL1_TERA1|nr:hypothetical protein NO1_1206 [Candidatus Termititenax aidoneus]